MTALFDAKQSALKEIKWREETPPRDIENAEKAVQRLSDLVANQFTATLRPPEISHDDEVRTLLDSITSDDLLNCTTMNSGNRVCAISLTANNEKMLKLFRLLSTPEQLAMTCHKLDMLVTSNYPVKLENGLPDALLLDQLYSIIKYNYLSILNTPNKPELYSILEKFGLFGKYSSDSFDKLLALARYCLTR